MAEEKELWKLSAGDKQRASGKSRSASFLFANMDELAGNGTIVIETEDDKVLNKAAEYAAQKGYDLASPDPEQNLKIIAKQNAMAGEDIAEGQLEPSTRIQKVVEPEKEPADAEKRKALDQLAKDKRDLDAFDAAIAYSDDRSQRAKEHAESKIRHAEIAEREKEYQEKGWLPPARLPKPKKVKQVETDDPAADIAKTAEQTKVQPEPFQQSQDGQGARPVDFSEKRPAEVLAERWKVPLAKDHGNRIVITRMGMLAVTPPQRRERHELVSAALLKARERFGEPVRVTGNKAFEAAVIKAAIEQGIPLEMGSDRGEKAYALALQGEEKRLAKTMGTLAPSKTHEVSMPDAAPAKGKGRELAR